MKRILLSVCVASALLGFPAEQVVAPRAEASNEIQTQTKKVDTLEILLTKLSNCESGGNPRIKILDTNDRYSYGEFMFQEETFKTYTRKYNFLPFAEDKEIMNFIYDADYQRQLTRRMIEDGEWYHWKICGLKIGLDKLKY